MALVFKASRGIEDIYELTHIRKDRSRFPATVTVTALPGDMTVKQRGFISDIFSSGKHMPSLMNDILDLSKVEAGKMLLDIQPVPITSLFANNLSIIRQKAAHRRVRLVMDAGEDLGSIYADATKVKQIVYNLLANAVKFTVDGGQVALRASVVPRASVGPISGAWPSRRFSLAEDSAFADFLEISVTDSGIGVSPEGLEQLSELIRLQLETQGFTVPHAASAEEALALAGAQRLCPSVARDQPSTDRP